MCVCACVWAYLTGPERDFIARNMELAKKKKNKKLTAGEFARLKELLGPLLSDEVCVIVFYLPMLACE